MKDAIAAGATSFRIPPGEHRLAGILELADLDGFTLEGSGATLIFAPGAGRLQLRRCTNCTVTGLALDMSPLPFTQGTVAVVDPIKKTVDFELDAGYPEFDPAAAEAGARCAFFDPGGESELGIIDMWILGAREIGPRVYRGTASRAFDIETRRLQAGDRIVVSLDRPGGGVELNECGKIRLRDVTVYASGGMAFMETGLGAGGHVYERCRVIRRPGAGRLIASASDGLHSLTQRKGPTLSHCEISHCLDDLVNIHGFIGFVLGRREGDGWVVVGPAGQDFSPESLVRLYRLPNAEPIGEARVLSCEPCDTLEPADAVREITKHVSATWGDIRLRSFDKPQPVVVRLDREDLLFPYDLVSCPDYGGSGAVIADCFFHDGHVRGILLKSSGSTVTRCRFERLARSAIVVMPELYWLEGPFPHDVRIDGNTLVDCGFGAVSTREKYWEFAPLMVVSNFSDRQFPPRFSSAVNMQRFEIIGNRIERAPGPGILVSNAEHVRLIRNTIVSPGVKPEAGHVLDLTRNLPADAAMSPSQADAMRDPSFGILLMAVRRVRCEGNRGEGGRGRVGIGWAVEDAVVQE